MILSTESKILKEIGLDSKYTEEVKKNGIWDYFYKSKCWDSSETQTQST